MWILGFSRVWMLRALVMLLAVLLVGTQMPGALRDALEHRLHAPFALSAWAHFGLFAAMATLARLPPLGWRLHHVGAAALALALGTEALQFLAVNRHPGLGDVLTDLAGATAGLLFAAGLKQKRPLAHI
ncbi:MAG: hypothetical protein KA254_01330 [Rhodoferax sp.]|nr:hypothetical protein [Rhodoferax sp.]